MLNGGVYFAIKSSVGAILLFKQYPTLSRYSVEFILLIAR